MSLRDKLKKDADSKHPAWMSTATPTTHALYNAALAEFNRIKAIIVSGKQIPLRDHKINQSSVSRNANRDKSILSMRRQPELMTWIKERNEELSQLICSKSAKQTRPSRNKLRSEVVKLKRQNNQALTDGLRSFVEKILSSGLLEDRDKLALDNIELKRDIARLREQLVNLRELCSTQAMEISRLHRDLKPKELTLTLLPDV